MSSPRLRTPAPGCATKISVASPSLVTGAKSRKVSNGIFAKTCGLITIVPSKPSSSVWPSASACATCCVPMLPLAPGRFSTITCWPRRAASGSATTRALLSATPPGVKGTMMRTGLVGHSCAPAALIRINQRKGVRAIFMKQV